MHERWWPIHLAAFTAFAVAQPLYDVLGQAPEFFVAHRAGPWTMAAFVAAVSLGLPAFLALLSAAARLFGRRPFQAVQAVTIAILVTCFALPIADSVTPLPANGVIASSVAVGVLFSVMYLRFSLTRAFVSAISPAVLVFPLMFVFASPVRVLVVPLRNTGPAPVALTPTVPVVLIVFDQLSTPALLRSPGTIDAARFPNFAALAKESTWFPRASAAHPHTGLALPAILTGRFPVVGRVPILAHYPENLFTWFGSSYELHVSEPMTALCPTTLCETDRGAGRLGFRTSTFLSDLAVVYLHVIVPDEYASTALPPLDGAWRDFRPAVSPPAAPSNESASWHGDEAFAEGVGVGRHVQVEQFVSQIADSGGRTLHFLHVLLPHHPYQYSASGRLNSPGWGPEGLRNDGTWEQSPQLVLTAYHQYIQQVGFVDRLLGTIIAELKAQGLYDDALVIVTSDHGVALIPGEPSRTPTTATYQDILSVPLFVKRPGQREGHANERLVSTLDLVPTIGDVLGAQVPWPVDGVSMFADTWQDPTSISIHGLGAEPLNFDPRGIGQGADDSVRRAALGAGTPLEQLAVKGPDADLIGQSLSDLPVTRAGNDIEITVGTLPRFERVDLNSGLVPALVHGHLRAPPRSVRARKLAVALNGRIRTTTEAVERSPGLWYFAVLLPEAAFQQGDNDLQFLLIDDSSGARRLLQLTPPNIRRIVRNAGGESLLAAGGRNISIQREAVWGWVEGIRHNPWMMLVSGWAADMQTGRPATAILVFAADELIAAGTPTFNRDDLPAALGKEGIRGSGYAIEVPRERLNGKYMSIRVFGLSADGTVASELKLNAAAQQELNSISR